MTAKALIEDYNKEGIPPRLMEMFQDTMVAYENELREEYSVIMAIWNENDKRNKEKIGNE